jgi:hypothetical protein
MNEKISSSRTLTATRVLLLVSIWDKAFFQAFDLAN